MKNFFSKKTLALLLAVLTLASLLPVVTMARTETETCPACSGALDGEGNHVQCETCGSSGTVPVEICDACGGRNDNHVNVCGECSQCNGTHASSCSQHPDNAPCQTCGGTVSAHLNVCGECSQCGNTHASTCSQHPDNAPCQTCGGAASAHLNVCDECSQCGNTHASTCSQNPDNAPCTICGGVASAHLHVCDECSQCGNTHAGDCSQNPTSYVCAVEGCASNGNRVAADHTHACKHCGVALPANGVCAETFSVKFYNGSEQIGQEQHIACNQAATAPEYPVNADNVAATGWNPASFDHVHANMTIAAVFPDDDDDDDAAALAATLAAFNADIMALPSVADVNAWSQDPASEAYRNAHAAFNAVASRLDGDILEVMEEPYPDAYTKILMLSNIFMGIQPMAAAPTITKTVYIAFDPTGGATNPGAVDVWLERIDGTTVDTIGPVSITPATGAGTSYTFTNLQSVSTTTHNDYIYEVFAESVSGYSTTRNGDTITYRMGTPARVDLKYAVAWVNAPADTTGLGVTLKLLEYDPDSAVPQPTEKASSFVGYSTSQSTGTLSCTSPSANCDYYIEVATALGSDYIVEYGTDATNGTKVTITYIGGRYAVQSSITWVDSKTSASARPAPRVDLFYNGGGVEHATGLNGDTYYAFRYRPAGETNGDLYTVAAYAAGYSVSYGARTVDTAAKTVSIPITFTANPTPVGSTLYFSVSWRDNYNKRGNRPTAVTVYLYCDGYDTGRATEVTAAGGWTGFFDDLPVNYGTHYYKYTLRQDKLGNYKTTYARTSYQNIHIINTYGYGSSSDTTGSTGISPKVGDPMLYKTAIAAQMYAEAAASAKSVAAAARANNAVASDTAVDFDTLKRSNADVVGWLTLADTVIDYPIVRGSNNTEYLTKLYTGEANSAGSLFMDYHNNAKFTNRNTTVFGHNMKDGSMFATLLKYREQNFYDAHPSMTLQTPDGDYTVEPFAGFYINDAYSNVVKRTFADNKAFMAYVEKCMRASDFQSKATVSALDQLVTFVTCSNDYGDGTRYLLVCKLSPANRRFRMATQGRSPHGFRPFLAKY